MSPMVPERATLIKACGCSRDVSKKRGDFGLLFFLCIISQKILGVIAILNTSRTNKTGLSEEKCTHETNFLISR